MRIRNTQHSTHVEHINAAYLHVADAGANPAACYPYQVNTHD